MEHLSQETIEKFVRGEHPYQRLLEIAAHLETCQNDCQETLNRIDPDFLADAVAFEKARIEALAKEDHFSEAEIESYILKTFDIAKRLKMNNHFTKCRRCAETLKASDPDYLSNFIKDTLNRNRESEIIVKEEEKGLLFRFLIPAAAFSVLILLSLAIIFMVPNNKTPEQVKLEEISTPSIATNNNENIHVNNTDNKGGLDPRSGNTQVKDKNVNSKSQVQTKPVQLHLNQKQANQTKSNKSQDIIVKNRSLNKNCENNPILAITPKDEVITDLQPNLTWKPYPNAVSYKIYLSDTANNLVEEADITNSERTSYKITNKLELNKKYEWKVVTSLKDGKEIYSEAASFSVGEKAKKISTTKDKTRNNEVRCLKSGNKLL